MNHSFDELSDIFFNKNTEKQPYQISNTIQIIFKNPHMLIQQLQHLKSPEYTNSESSLDISQILKLYENIDSSKMNAELAKVYIAELQELANLSLIQQYVKSAKEMKYFFIIFLWNRLFAKENNKLFNLFVQLIAKTQFYHQIFTIWVQDVSTDYLRYVIKQLHQKIKEQCSQLEGIEQSQQIKKVLADNCKLICILFKIIFESNKNKQRIPFAQFNNSYITTTIQPIQTFKAYIKKTNQFSFISYPFLLDFNYKYKLMQIQSIYEQKLSIKKNMENGLLNLIQNLQNGIEGLIYLYFAVRRNNILDDSMEKLGKIKLNLKSPLRIEFIGEQGADQGGVKNQYFALITKSIFNPYLDMFIPKNFGRFYWFNGFSYQLPLRFEFVGTLLGLSLFNSVHLDIHFPQITFKKLLNKKYQDEYGIEIIEDLKQIQPQIYRTLKNILEQVDDVSVIELYFNIQLQSFGQKIVNELVQDGNFIQVNNDNREYYCLLYADYILNKHIAKQFDAFRKGFYRVVQGGIIKTFQAEELRILIHGTEDIDIKELQENTHYEGGYSPQTPIIKAFWQFLYKLNHEEKKNFLTFVTGTDRVPIDGLKSLKFLIQRHTNTKNLPTAHTCFNVLLLPEYENSQILIKNLRLILEHNQGFGLI